MESMRKLYNFEVKQLEDRVLRFTGSTETEDREGEVIKVSGWDLTNYKKNPVFMWAHDYSQPPIGKAVNVHKRQGNLVFDIEFAPKETYEFADTIYKLYQGGFLNATSVGFMPDPEGIIEGDGIKSPRRTYTKQELLELSAVPVPSNPDALRNAADKLGVNIKSLKGIFEDAVDLTEIIPEEIHKPKEYSQKEIEDEIEFTKLLISENGMNEITANSARGLVKEIMRLTGNDIPDEIKPAANGVAKEKYDDEKLKLIISQTVKNVINNS